MVGYVQDAIVLLGDSLTQGGTIPHGFVQQLTGECASPSQVLGANAPASDVYNRKLDVIVRGLSGYNTTWIFPVFEKVRVTPLIFFRLRANHVFRSFQRSRNVRTYPRCNSSLSGSARTTPAFPASSNTSRSRSTRRTSAS